MGNDLEGLDYGYKIHLVYDIVATPSDVSFPTVSDSVSVTPFEWELRATPSWNPGLRAVSHISLDSRRMNPAKLLEIETILYGSDLSNPELPALVDMLSLVQTP